MTDSENVMALMWEFNTYLTMCDQKRGLREMFINVAQCCFGKKERKKKYDEMVDYYVRGRLGGHYPYRWRARYPHELSTMDPHDDSVKWLKKGVLQLRDIVECNKYTPGGGPADYAYLSDMLVWKVCSNRMSLHCNPIGEPPVQITKENCESYASKHLRMLFKDKYQEDRVALFNDCQRCSSVSLFDCLYWCCVFTDSGERRISKEAVTKKIMFILQNLHEQLKLVWHLCANYKEYIRIEELKSTGMAVRFLGTQDAAEAPLPK